jgi:hypothetical protein
MADERRTVSEAEESQPEAPRPHVVGQGPNYTSGECIDTLFTGAWNFLTRLKRVIIAFMMIPREGPEAAKPHVVGQGQDYTMVSALILSLRVLRIF